MNTVIVIILLVIAALIGAAIAYFIAKKDIILPTIDEDEIIQRDEKIKELTDEISSLNSQYVKLKEDTEHSAQLLKAISSNDENAVLKIYQNQIEKLKKEIDDLEDDNEDLEDDVKDYQKKYNEQKKRYSDNTQSLNRIQNEKKRLEDSIQNVNIKLEEEKSIVNGLKESIQFVNEILLAKDANNQDIKIIDEKISAIENIVIDEVKDVLGDSENKDIKTKIWQWGNLQRKTWLQGKKVIAFVGEFSAGKTSIVNRILSQDNDNAPKLPVSSKATTAIATYISWGSDFNSQFTNPQGKLKNISKTTFESVNKDILSRINISPLIQYFVMSYNNENLRDLSILDTPGFNSNDREDANRTVQVIREADALFWVFDANSGEINQTSLKVIRENLQGLPLFIVINKADTKSSGELEQLEAHIKGTIEKNDIKVNDYIRFSKKASIDVLMDAIRSVKHKNKNNYIAETVYPALIKVINIYENKYKEYSARKRKYLNLQRGSGNKISFLLENVQKYCEDIQNIPDLKSSWFGLGSQYYKMSKDTYDEFIEQIENIGDMVDIDLRSKINEYIDSTDNLNEAQSKIDGIKDKLQNLRSLKERFDRLLKNWNPDFFNK